MHIRTGFRPHDVIAAGLVLVAALLGSISSAESGRAAESAVVELRSGRVDLAASPSAASLSANQISILKLRQPLSPDARSAAERLGVRFEMYLGDDVYLVRLPTDVARRKRALPDAVWIAPYASELRVGPEIQALTASDPRARIPVTVHLLADADVAARAMDLESLGIDLGGTSSGRAMTKTRAERQSRIVALPTPAQIDVLRSTVASWNDTLWLGRRPAYRLLNDASVGVVQSGLGAGGATPLFDQGLFGEDQVIAVLDTGLDADMCFFRDDEQGLPPVNVGFGVGAPDPNQRKVLIVNFLAPGDDPADPFDWDNQDHGTHVAGSALGDDLATPGVRDAGDGMAPAAKLVVQDGGFAFDDCADLPAIGCPAADLYPFFEQAYAQGARIHSNSYGDRENFSPPDIYSEGSQAADAFMWDHPDFLLVFAAGNGGNGLAEATIASPATGKNVLAVGASQPGVSAGQMASFSSQGPTADGRIKPDVIAPGQSVVSADNDGDIGSQQCQTRSLSGTSMACPTAAGMAALVRQYYMDGFYPTGSADPADGFVPSAALLKATLIASTTAMEGEPVPPPSPAQGWGRLKVDDALFFTGDLRRSRVFDESAAFTSAEDADHTHSFEVISASEPLSIVLTWTDYPSNPAAMVNLVNDLNLEVVSPTGAVYLGNVFDNGESLSGVGTADALNNVEVVRVAAPAVGRWTVRVRPHAIPQPAQGYALVALGGMPAIGPALQRTALDLADSPGGNGDDILDPGEWLDLSLSLLNSGNSPATSITATLTSLTPGIDITHASIPFPDLDPSAEAAGSGKLQLRIPVDHPCTDPVIVQLTYRAMGFEQSETLTLPTGTRRAFLVDDFEAPTSWVHVAAESDATNGAWVIGDPTGTAFQPEDDATPAPGVNCLYTAVNFNGVGADDVDNGTVVARSGSYDLTGHPDARLSITRWFGNRDVGEDPGDLFQLAIRENALSPDVLLEELGTEINATSWTTVDFRVADFVPIGADIELRVSVADERPVSNIIEGAIDDITFWEPVCNVFVPAPTPPHGVTDLRLSRASSSDIALAWSRPTIEFDHSGATHYSIYRSSAADAGFTQVGTLEDSSALLGFTTEGALGGDALQFYQVVAGNDAGDAEVLP